MTKADYFCLKGTTCHHTGQLGRNCCNETKETWSKGLLEDPVAKSPCHLSSLKDNHLTIGLEHSILVKYLS